MLKAKNASLDEQFRLFGWPRYDYDLAARQLTFSQDGQAKVVADIQVVGTASLKASNCYWAWDNAHWPLEYVMDAERVRSFGQQHEFDELKDSYVDGDDLNGLG